MPKGTPTKAKCPVIDDGVVCGGHADHNGMCNKHWTRFKRHGDPTVRKIAWSDPHARFWQKVDKNGPVARNNPELGQCWIWTAARNVQGYGRIGSGTKVYLAHRFAYELLIGSIPEGRQLDHFACDNGPGGCVNPHHCRPVTPRENLLRSEGMSSRYLSRTHCQRGHEYTPESTYVRANGSREPLAAVDNTKTLFFPGAFNPPHEGHFSAAQVTQETLAVKEHQSRRVVFSTTVNPPHKAALSTAEVLQRAKLMKGHDFLVTENDPLYIDKARKFPGAYFVMGADAMDRMLDPKWGVPVRPMLNEFSDLGTRFLVPGRLVQLPLCNEFLTCGKVMGNHMAEVLGKSLLFVPVDFRHDLSSTEVRAKAG